MGWVYSRCMVGVWLVYGWCMVGVWGMGVDVGGVLSVGIGL